MVLAIGSFRVSKYAQSAIVGGAGAEFGIPGAGIGGGVGIPGVPDSAGNFNLVPGHTFPQTLLPGGESIPGIGGSPFLPGGVPMTPAFSETPFGPIWDLNQGGFDRGIHELGPRSGDKLFGSRIINVNVPKMISAGQQFVIMVTYAHDERGEQFGTYKIKITLPALNIVETTAEKRVGAGAHDSVPINLTAPAPLPLAPVTGTVELIQTEGTDVTIDSEVISIPTEAVPNPPIPTPPPDSTPPYPIPTPPPSEPPEAPPPPPVPLPPVLQQVSINVTRGQDGGFEAIIIEAVNLEPSEPTTVFIYLSTRKDMGRHRGWYKDRDGRDHNGDDNDDDRDRNWGEWRDRIKTTQTPAGSVAIAGTDGASANASNYARSYPVSIQGTTINGNGLTLNRTMSMPNMPSVSSIQALVNERLRERLRMVQPGRVDQYIQQTARSLPEAQTLKAQIEAKVQSIIVQASTQAGGAGATAAAGVPGVGVGLGVGGIPPGLARPPKIYKRQRVSITATPEGTIRHIVRVREATPATPLFGYVIIYGNRSRKHTGRRKFQI
jgi:hypothetical protein